MLPRVLLHNSDDGTIGAANRMPDKCDADPEGTKAINVQATEALAVAANSRNILLLYISTDYVFPGREGEAPYEAGSPTEPPNFYGKTKLDGENAVLSTTAKAGLGVVLRIPVLYGKVEESRESAINVLMDSVWKAQEKGAKLLIDDWSIRYPTNTEDVARVILDISTKYFHAVDKTALPHVLQFSSEDRMTKYEICEVFSEIMGLSMDGMAANKQGNDPTSKTQRPYDCHLSTAELKRIGISVHTQDFKAWWCVYPA